MKKEDLPFFGTSFKFSGQAMLGGANFLTDLQAFGAEGKDLMNEETVLTRRDFLQFLNLNFGKTASPRRHVTVTPSMRPHERFRDKVRATQDDWNEFNDINKIVPTRRPSC